MIITKMKFKKMNDVMYLYVIESEIEISNSIHKFTYQMVGNNFEEVLDQLLERKQIVDIVEVHRTRLDNYVFY